MYALLHELLCDRQGGETFTCFGGWHFFYILLTFAVIVTVCLVLRNRGQEVRDRAASVFIHLAFGLYIADFFLMPFAYEKIDMEKLPFHVCTAMCVMCFLSRHVPALEKYRVHFALLGFLSNLVYLIYPAGVMWHAVHPLCYRVVQTLLFHGVMTVYGAVALLFDRERLSWKTAYRDVLTVAGMTLWAVLGNALYRGSAGSYSHDFNWFFVTADPFGLIDPRIAPYVMPFLNTAVFLAAELPAAALANLLRGTAGAPQHPVKEREEEV